MTKKQLQELKYLENEKSFYVEIRSICRHFKMAFNEENNRNFFGKWESDFKFASYTRYPSQYEKQNIQSYLHFELNSCQYF